MVSTSASAVAYVSTLDLSGVDTYTGKGLADGLPRFTPDATKNQVVVVGSEVQSFVTGVDAEVRRALQNAALLAQLVATKKAGGNVEAWYDEYFTVLEGVGLISHEKVERKSYTQAVDVDIEKVVLDIAASLLGGVATTAYTVLKVALEALSKLGSDSPTIKLFRREVQKESGRFQVSVVEPSTEEHSSGGVAITLIAFTFDAAASEHQVLFVKTKAQSASLTASTAKMGIAEDALNAAADDVRELVLDYVEGYVRELKKLQL